MNDELEKKEKELAREMNIIRLQKIRQKRILDASEHPEKYPHITKERNEQSRIGVQESINIRYQYCDKLTKEIEEIKAKRKQ